MLLNIVVFVTIGLWSGLILGCIYAVCKVLYKTYLEKYSVENNKNVELLERTLISKHIDFSDLNIFQLEQYESKAKQELYIKLLKNRLYSKYFVNGMRGLIANFFPKQFYIFNDLEEELSTVTDMCLNMNRTELSLTFFDLLSKIKIPEEFNDDNYDNSSSESSNMSKSDKSDKSHESNKSSKSNKSHESDGSGSDSSNDSNGSNSSNCDSKESRNSNKSNQSNQSNKSVHSSKSNGSEHSGSSGNSGSSVDLEIHDTLTKNSDLVADVLYGFISSFSASYKLEKIKQSILA